MAKRTTENCRLIKVHGEPGKDGKGQCRGFATTLNDEPIEACKRCKWCMSNQDK